MRTGFRETAGIGSEEYLVVYALGFRLIFERGHGKALELDMKRTEHLREVEVCSIAALGEKVRDASCLVSSTSPGEFTRWGGPGKPAPLRNPPSPGVYSTNLKDRVGSLFRNHG